MVAPPLLTADLRCLECGGDLATAADVLQCAGCGERYPILRSTPRLLSRGLRDRLLSTPGVRDRAGSRGGRGEPGPGERGETQVKLRTAASFGFEWQHFAALRPEWERNFLAYMQPRSAEFFRGKRILDAGCGTGRHAYYAASYGAEVVAVDLSDAIDVARENTWAIGRVTTIQADLYRLPFADESFDFIYSIGVLHHLPDPEAAFRNLLRYLKPGGEIQIYLYWQPVDQPLKRAMLSLVTAMRAVTTRLPHRLLYLLSHLLGAGVYGGFVLPYRLLRAARVTARLAERMPMRQYAGYPFRVCVNDQFDRFSAPIERRYTREEVEGWLRDAGLTEARVLPNWGWLGSGRKPAEPGSG